MHYLEFVKRMLMYSNTTNRGIIVNIKLNDEISNIFAQKGYGKASGLSIRLEDIEIGETGLNCTGILSDLDIKVSDASISASGFAGISHFGELDITLENSGVSIECQLATAIYNALKTRLSDLITRVSGLNATSKYVEGLIRLNEQLVGIDVTKIQPTLITLEIKSNDEVSVINAELGVGYDDIAAVNIKLNDSLIEYNAAIWFFIYTTLTVYCEDLQILDDALISQGITSDVVVELEEQTANIIAEAFKWSMLLDYDEDYLEQMDNKTLQQLDKIIIGG